MKYLRNTKTLAVLSAVILIWQMATLGRKLLVNAPAGRTAGSNQPVIGEWKDAGSSARARSAGGLTWFQMKKGEAVYSRDTVVTGNESGGHIRLTTGEEIFLGKNALITFPSRSQLLSGGEYLFELKQGNVEVKSYKKKVAIKTSTETLVVQPKSQIGIQQAPQNSTPVLRVVKGEIENPSKFTVQKVEEPKATEQEPIQIVEDISQLNLRLRTPRDNQVFHTETGPYEIYFSWNGGKRYSIQVASDPEFRFLETLTSDASYASKTLSPGTYFWRIKSQENVSDTRTFRIIEKTPPVVARAPEPERPKPVKRTIARQAEPQYETPQPVEEIQPSLNPNAVVNHLTSSGRVLSAPRRATAQARNVGRKTIEPKTASSYQVMFDWSPVPGAAGYLIQVSTSPYFAKMAYEFEADSPGTEMSLLLDKDATYYYRVLARDVNGDAGTPSAPSQIAAGQ